METNTYLALLRGINVGGNNIIKMADLRNCFEQMGFARVTTYIQSGNVLFNSSEHDAHKVCGQIEQRLSKEFAYKSKVILVTTGQLDSVVNNAPETFGKQPDDYRYDILFLKQPLGPGEVMQNITTKVGVDRAWPGDCVVYFSRLIEKAGSSHLNKIVSQPLYQNITIRNWNTTTRLYAMLNQ